MKPRYLLFQKAEAALIEEKAEKLFGLTRLLEKHLVGDFEDILNSVEPRPATKAEKIRVLNEALAPFTDLVAQSFPGVGVGYYCKDLQAIVTYGPSSEFGNKVGMDLGPGHIGAQAMELGKEVVGVGSMVRGDIMNCVRPIIRKGKAVGFVWANEAVADIYAQIQVGARKVFFSTDIQPILGLTGLLLFASRSLLLPPRLPPTVLASRDARRRRRHSDFRTALSYIHQINRMHRYVMLFLNSLSVGVLVADSHGVIIFANDGLLRIVERKREEVVGKPCARFLEAVGLPAEGILAADSEIRNRFVKLPVKVASGTKEIFLISAHVSDEPRGREGTILLFEDLEQATMEEERLQKAEKLAAVGELAAAIAHEIRNPLTIVAGSIQLIPQKLTDKEFLVNSSKILAEELGRVNRTVEALLNFARFSKPRWVVLDLNQAVERAVDVIRAYAKAGSVTIKEDYWKRESIIIEGDPEHLQQAFLNLMLNALQAMPSGGELRVSTCQRPNSNYAQVSFEDTGVGIPEEEQEKIFDMFYSTKKGGTGLGLPLVQRIVDEHKGYMELVSKVGKGTRFTVNLPLRQLFPKLAE
ncbi:MAG TPA: PAS domain-containing protein [Firmicutes bacterium]|nr:PAS domain-containing protein [Bacillota bacterium]